MKSLIEHALARDEAPSLSLFWLATRPDGHFMANQCRAWSAALDSFEHQLATTRPGLAARQMAQAMRADLFDIACDFTSPGRSLSCKRSHDEVVRGWRAGLADPCGGGGMSDCAGAEVFALQVLGQSMAPEFEEGEIIVIEPEGALRDSSFVLAQLDGSGSSASCAARASAALHALNLAFAAGRCRSRRGARRGDPEIAPGTPARFQSYL